MHIGIIHVSKMGAIIKSEQPSGYPHPAHVRSNLGFTVSSQIQPTLDSNKMTVLGPDAAWVKVHVS